MTKYIKKSNWVDIDRNGDADDSHAHTIITPNSRSLGIARSLAESLGLPFDESQVRKTGTDLLSLYFDEVVSVMGSQYEGIAFTHGSTNEIAAYAGLNQFSKGEIFFDEHLHFWLFSLNFLVVFRACYHFSDEEKSELSRLTFAHFDMLEDPIAMHVNLREELLPLITDFDKILPAVNALTQSMCVFIICHEIAHHVHQHTEIDSSANEEFVADSTAFNLLLEVSEQRDQLNHAQVDQSTLGGPCLMLAYFSAAFAHTTGGDTGSNTHPPASSRRDRLWMETCEKWPSTSLHRYEVMSEIFDEMVGGTSK